MLRDNRPRDAAAGRTLDGPHLTDLSVVYVRKNIAAGEASTGEQKALLIGLVLAQARLIAEMTASTPVLLLDEVVAHLDPGRRAALHGELRQLGAQVWMTGADPALFAEVRDEAAMIEVRSGSLAAQDELIARTEPADSASPPAHGGSCRGEVKEQSARKILSLERSGTRARSGVPNAMPGRIEEIIVRNLIEALDDKDVDRVEQWSAAFEDLRRPVPGYRPAINNCCRCEKRSALTSRRGSISVAPDACRRVKITAIFGGTRILEK